MNGDHFDTHADDDAFGAFMAELDQTLSRAGIALALLALLGLAGLTAITA